MAGGELWGWWAGLVGSGKSRSTGRGYDGRKPVDGRVLAGVGFSDHAIDRFAERAGLDSGARSRVEPVIRDLLLQEGFVTAEQPRWARSQNTADCYLQLGDWMLFVLRADRRRPGCFTAVTVVNGPADNDWAMALRRGYILTPPPPRYEPLLPVRVSLVGCIRVVLAERREPGSGGSLVARVASTYRERRSAAGLERARVASANRAARDEYEGARARARESRGR